MTTWNTEMLRIWNTEIDVNKPLADYTDDNLIGMIEEANLEDGYENGSFIDFVNLNYDNFYDRLVAEVKSRMSKGATK